MTRTKKQSLQTPAQLGFRFPAEWEPHQSTWLAWPHNQETWPDLKVIETLFLEMIEIISQGEVVNLLVSDAQMEARVVQKLARSKVKHENITFFHIPTCDVWIRDYGPNFIVSANQKAISRWQFNAWGAKYEDQQADAHVLEKIVQQLPFPAYEPHMILEGGSIDSNGKGVLLTTEQCLLNQNRNASFKKKEIEEKLSQFLGVKKIIWLAKGIAGDDTDGHIDDVARFVNESTIVCVVTNDVKNYNYLILQENLSRLRSAQDHLDKSLSVIELPMPESIQPLEVWKAFWPEGPDVLPASYANFYICNEAVLVPIFGDPLDREALNILKNLFPNRRVVGIRSEILIYGLGGIHCITHEEPL